MMPAKIPAAGRISAAILLLAILGVAGVLRFANLGAAPVHADEAVNATLLDQRFKEGYRFDASHFHGPALSLVSAAWMRVLGETESQKFRIESLRTISAALGLATVLVVMVGMRPWLGRWGSVTAGALAAVSPLLVYFSRLWIHETLLGFFAVLALVCVKRHIHHFSLLWACGFGATAGLMFATKATFIVAVGSWLPAAVLAHWATGLTLIPEAREERRAAWWAGLGAIVAFLIVAWSGYTEFGARPGSLFEAFRSFFVYRLDPGHDKPWHYFLRPLVWPEKNGGIWWSEAPLNVLALGGAALAWRNRRNPECRDAAWLGLFAISSGLMQAGFFSMLAYKTPWLMIVPWLYASLTAGAGVEILIRKKASRLQLAGVTILVGAAVLLLSYQTWLASFRFPNDARNPYAYSPTSSDAPRLAEQLKSIAEASPARIDPLVVIGTDYWPLPWYLRGFERVGYWDALPGGMNPPIVLAMPDKEDAVAEALGAGYFAFPLGLRDGVPVMVHVREDLWSAWQEKRQP